MGKKRQQISHKQNETNQQNITPVDTVQQVTSVEKKGLTELITHFEQSIQQCRLAVEEGKAKETIAAIIRECILYGTLLLKLLNNAGMKVALTLRFYTRIDSALRSLILLTFAFQGRQQYDIGAEFIKVNIDFNETLEKIFYLDESNVTYPIIRRTELQGGYFYLGEEALRKRELIQAREYLKKSFSLIRKPASDYEDYSSLEGYYASVAKLATYEGDIRAAKKYVALADYYRELTAKTIKITGFTLREAYLLIGNHYFSKQNFEISIKWYEEALWLLKRQAYCFSKALVQKEKIYADKKVYVEIKPEEIAKIESEIKQNLIRVEWFLKTSRQKVFEKRCSLLIKNADLTSICVVDFDCEAHSAIFQFKNELDAKEFSQSLKIRKWPHQIKDNGAVICVNLIDILPKVLNTIMATLIKNQQAQEQYRAAITHTSQHIQDEITCPKSTEKAEISTSELEQQIKAAKLSRHQENERHREQENQESTSQGAETSKKQTDSSLLPEKNLVKNVSIEWDNIAFPSYQRNVTQSFYGKMYQKKRAPTYWCINQTVQDALDNVAYEKVENAAESGQTYFGKGSKNRQGFVFFQKNSDPNVKDYPDYDCKIKIQGRYANLRIYGHKVATGVKSVNAQVEKNNCELYEFDKVVIKAHK